MLNVPGCTSNPLARWKFSKDVPGGCVVSTLLAESFVGKSKAAFDALMARLQEPEITAEYQDPQPEALLSTA